MKVVWIGVLLAMTSALAVAQEKMISTVKSMANQTVSVEGSLAPGIKLSDLSWAWRSSTACFVEPQKSKYTGNHVFYVTELPPRSILTVTVKPKNSSANLSIYGYQIAAGKVVFPDQLTSAVTCEADHKWDRPVRGKTQDDSRTVTFNATTNSYNVVIGVAGADGLSQADFTVKFALKQ